MSERGVLCCSLCETEYLSGDIMCLIVIIRMVTDEGITYIYYLRGKQYSVLCEHLTINLHLCFSKGSLFHSHCYAAFTTEGFRMVRFQQ